MRQGAVFINDDTCRFKIWAPLLSSVELKICFPQERIIPMQRDEYGYWEVIVDGISEATRYLFILDKATVRPDPSSSFQPDGVHAPSSVVRHHDFKWDDALFRPTPLDELIIYEVHVGSFSEAGTFEGIIGRIDDLKWLGINAIQLMPVSQFPGQRNWGYDGVYPYAVQNSYGGPEGLRKLVNECHKNDISVILDVVYNHLGPEGNYLWGTAPYFTDKYKTPWGNAINFDCRYSDPVKRYFIENALFWIDNYHIDGLRLDAVHAIYDFSARHFLQLLSEEVQRHTLRLQKSCILIAESDLNDSRIITPRCEGGYGIDAQWCDDFHHGLHTVLTAETEGYYTDFGSVGALVKSLSNGYVYDGQYSRYRGRTHGNSASKRGSEQFIVFTQNHDQTGNRMMGERLSTLVEFEALKLAAGIMILSPFVPMLFMGEEYGEDAPFLYFVSHSDTALIESVRKGRREGFKAVSDNILVPDPQAEETFLASRLRWNKRNVGHHKELLEFYRYLIKLRKTEPAFSNPNRENVSVYQQENNKLIIMKRSDEMHTNHAFCLFNLSGDKIETRIFFPEGKWEMFFLSYALTTDGGSDSPIAHSVENYTDIELNGYGFVIYRKLFQ